MTQPTLFDQPVQMQVHTIWKDIPGFEGYYQVSDAGIIKRLETSVTWRVRSGAGHTRLLPARILKPIMSGNYPSIMLCVKSERKMFLIHRLVAIAFIENPLGKKMVNHIDGNKHNNHISNLEWCTARENELHKYRVLKNLNGANNLPGIELNLESPTTIAGQTFYGVKSQDTIKSLVAGSRLRVTDFENVHGAIIMLSRLKRLGVPISTERVYTGGRNYYKEYFITQENIKKLTHESAI